ncbi:hypothetical protein C8J56DRAFT_1090335 [Mycena floridula]|nr:hypothetical protein C8J56DRAFT_1090335 [Mycena floridula]
MWKTLIVLYFSFSCLAQFNALTFCDPADTTTALFYGVNNLPDNGGDASANRLISLGLAFNDTTADFISVYLKVPLDYAYAAICLDTLGAFPLCALGWTGTQVVIGPNGIATIPVPRANPYVMSTFHPDTQSGRLDLATSGPIVTDVRDATPPGNSTFKITTFVCRHCLSWFSGASIGGQFDIHRDNHTLWLLGATDGEVVANLTTSFNFHSRENFPGSLAVSISRMNTTAGKPMCGVSALQASTLNTRFFVCSKVSQSVECS